MRIYALYLVVASLAVVAARYWFASLCGLILLTCVLQRRDMPSYIMEIQGLNPWNFLMAVIVFFWLLRRRADGLRWDLPRSAGILLVMYLVILTVADLRAVLVLGQFHPPMEFTALGFLSDEFINVVKFIIPGLIIYDACRTRRQVLYALIVISATFVIYALLTIKCMPLHALNLETGFMKYRHRIDRDTGLYATDIAMVFVGGVWGILSLWGLATQWKYRIAILLSSLTIVIGLGLTHARTAYIAFCGLAVVFSVLRWRKLFFLYPIALLLVFVFMPSIPMRLGTGLAKVQVSGDVGADMEELGAGRFTYLWPLALEQIADSPFMGHGRRATFHTSYYPTMVGHQGVCPSHPHNIYLDILMDAGIVGLVPVLSMFLAITWMSARLFMSKTDPLESAVGGLALGCVGSLLICGLASQTFFGTQSMMGFWCAWGLALRMHVARSRAPIMRMPGRRTVGRGRPLTSRHPVPQRPQRA